MSSTPLILVAGLVDPFVCFELLALHTLVFWVARSYISAQVKAPHALIFFSSIGVAFLFFLLNIVLLHLLGWTAIQDPVLMWYAR